MHGSVQRECRRFRLAIADHGSIGIDLYQVAGPQFGPVRAIGVQQKPTRPTRDRQAAVVVDALVEAVQCTRPEQRRQVGPCLGFRHGWL